MSTFGMVAKCENHNVKYCCSYYVLVNDYGMWCNSWDCLPFPFWTSSRSSQSSQKSWHRFCDTHQQKKVLTLVGIYFKSLKPFLIKVTALMLLRVDNDASKNALN